MKKMLLMVLTALTVVGFAAGCSNNGEENNTGTNTENNAVENTEENAE
ncbi:hypothetical protein ACQUWN_13880 [Rossellomorea aquimaris]|nr:MULTISPECIES: hypothetical protein [Bacillaceae]